MLKYNRSVLKLLNTIKEEGYGLFWNNYPPVLYHQYCLNFYRLTQGKDFHVLSMPQYVNWQATCIDVAE